MESRPQGGRRPDQERDKATIETNRIVFVNLEPSANLAPDLFNGIARKAAQDIANNTNTNRPSQIRKFYDELCMWETKVSLNPERFADYLPFILMLNAKAAYAHGRKPMLVDANFVKLIEDCLRQVENPKTLHLCKVFFEALLGFYKELRPSEK